MLNSNYKVFAAIGVIAVLLSIFVCSGCVLVALLMNASNRKPNEEEPKIAEKVPKTIPKVFASIDASELYEEFMANEAKAMGRYDGKEIEVVAMYHSLQESNKAIRDSNGKWRIAFLHTGPLHRNAEKSSNRWWWGQWDAPTVVVVFFKDSELAKLGELHPEDGALGNRGLTFQGTCRGTINSPARSPFGRFVGSNRAVLIENATVVHEVAIETKKSGAKEEGQTK